MTTYIASNNGYDNVHTTPYVATNQYGAAPTIVTQQVPAVAAAPAVTTVPATTTTTTTTAAPRVTRTVLVGKHMSAFAILLALVATILYIVAITTPAYFGDYAGNGIGLYRSCAVDKSGQSQTCADINQCTMRLNGLQEHGLPACDKFKAMRALSIVAVVLGGICVLMMMFTHYRQRQYEASSAMLFLSMISGLIVMAIAIDYYIENIRSDDAVSYFASSLGYSFIVGTVAWILQLVALCTFSSTHYATRYNTIY